MIKFDCTQNHSGVIGFKGMATRLPSRRINNASDAIAQWNLLRNPKYTQIFQEEEVSTQAQRTLNKQIRNDNYSFLDKLVGTCEKSKFIEYFKQVTGFPNLELTSKKIVDEFNRVLKLATNVFYDYFSENGYHEHILVSGYDEFCSVGLKSALPGSDLDKGFAIIDRTDSSRISQKEFSDLVKGKIWANIDNRIMSVNHTAAFPNIMTNKELAENVHLVDSYAKEFVNSNNLNYFRYQRLDNTNIISGARFNIWLSQRLPSESAKYNAKNLAYIVEAIRDGNHINLHEPYMPELYNILGQSEFCNCSNVIQSKKMQYKYDYGNSNTKKTKLLARQDAARGFNSWSIDRQYDLVKDIIRSMSGDSNNPAFKDLFYSPNDRGRLLLNDILRGKVGCYIEPTSYGEQTILSFTDGEMAEKYADINVYNL